MDDKICKTCVKNDNGLCDRKGILIEEDDSCENHTKNWMDSFMREVHPKINVVRAKMSLPDGIFIRN